MRAGATARQDHARDKHHERSQGPTGAPRDESQNPKEPWKQHRSPPRARCSAAGCRCDAAYAVRRSVPTHHRWRSLILWRGSGWGSYVVKGKLGALPRLAFQHTMTGRNAPPARAWTAYDWSEHSPSSCPDGNRPEGTFPPLVHGLHTTGRNVPPARVQTGVVPQERSPRSRPDGSRPGGTFSPLVSRRESSRGSVSPARVQIGVVPGERSPRSCPDGSRPGGTFSPLVSR